MQELIHVESQIGNPEQSTWLCEQLERGNILVLDAKDAPFVPADEDSAFLRSQKQSDSTSHKNIAYKPDEDRTTGVQTENAGNAHRLHQILARYSNGAAEFLAALLPRYAEGWKVDYASLRAVEEQGRGLPTKHRNDLMHVDAFPTRPTHGGRILRAFTNIHPTKPRVWAVAEPFDKLIAKYGKDAGLDTVTEPSAARKLLSAAGRGLGIKMPDRSAYDEFMLGFHHYMKENAAFQGTEWTNLFTFPPGSTWISFTDQVPHKVVSGQYALEQTCIVPFSAMVHPEFAPLSILERAAGRHLVAR